MADVQETLKKIRKALGEYDGDEKALLEELHAESEGWRMRLQELDLEAEDSE